MNERKVALEILQQVFIQGRSLNSILPKYEQHENISIIKQYAFGVCRWYYQSRSFLKQLLTKPLKEKDSDIELLLILGIYEISHMRTPEYTVVDECVKTAKQLEKNWATGLVNAVLRNFIRNRETLNDNIHSHPKWLLKKIQKAWPTHWQQIIEANNTQPPMILRVNRLQTTAKKYLEQNNIGKLIEDIPEAIVLNSALPVREIPGFEEGIVSVQDQSAQLAAHLLDLQPNLRVLDACAAPGGKTCHILELEPKLEQLTAIDVDPQRLQLIEQNLQRLKLTAQVVCADATQSDWWDQKPYDRILLDAPCSATGVIRRHPDIKFHRKSTDIEQLNQQQLSLLESLWPLLKPGGRMVYATCSVLPEENDAIIEQFLANKHNAVVKKTELNLGYAQPHGLQLLPEIKGGDGFYYAIILKSIP